MSDGLPRSVDASAGVGVTPSEAPLGEGHVVHDEIDVELDERDDARPSSPSPSVGLKAKARPRPRMTLRIPDDEVARPLSAPPPEPSPPSRAEIAPNRIITINSPPRPGPSSPASKAAEADETAPVPVPPSSPTLPDATLSTSSDVSLPEPADEPLEVVSVDAVAPPPPPETAPILPPSVIPRPAPVPSVPVAAAPARPAVPRPSPSTPAAAGSVRPPPPVVARTLPSSPPPRPPSLSPPNLTPPAPPVDGVGRLPPPPRIATDTEPLPDSEDAPPVPSEDFEDAESTAPTPPPPPAQAGALGTLPPIPTPPAVPRRLSTPADPIPALVNHAESFARKPASAESPESDSLEIPVEEDEEFSRVSEPEILADDLVSVDAALDDAPKPPPAPAPAPTKKSSLPPAAASSSPTVSSLLTSSPGQASLAVSGEISVVRNSSEPPSPEPPPFAPPRAPDVAPPPQASSASVSYSELSPPPMSEAAAQRKRGRPWWEELFNDDFIRTMAKISDEQIAEEADFIEDSLGVAKGAMILDLACGTGRHAIELTRRGYQVVGYDLSLSMLARAADEAQDRNQKLNFVQGDMREMTFEETFDGIYSWNTSFGFFEEEKNAQVVGRVHRALRKGGQFLLDVVNRDFIGRQAPSLAWFEGEGCICMDEMQIDWITSRMRVKRTMMMDDGRSKEIEYSIRLYSLHELGRLLHDHGFRVAEVSGRVATPGVFFGSDSPRTLILAEKR